MHSWCTLGSHLVNSLPFNLYHPYTLLSPYQIQSDNPSIPIYFISIISPYQSLNLFYLYLHIYPSILSISISISTSIPLFILSLSPHLYPDFGCNANRVHVLLCSSSPRRCDGKIADVSHDINGDQGEPCYDCLS